MTAISRSDDPEAGFTLVVVLWFLVLLAAFVGPFALAARIDVLITSNQREQEKLDFLADGLATLLADRLATNPQSADLLPLNSQPIDCSTEDIAIIFTVQDQAGLIDLNAADTPTIAAGLQFLGVGQAIAADLSAAIVDYRSYAASSGDIKPGNVAVAGGLKRAPFKSVVELTDFAPLAQVEAARLHAAFTIHSGSGIVNRATAPATLNTFFSSLPTASGRPNGLRGVAIEAAVRNRTTAISGYAGYIVELSSRRRGGFRRVEQLLPGATTAQPLAATSRCPAWLINDVAAVAGGDA